MTSLRARTTPWLVIVLFPILVSFPVLTGMLQNDPALLYGNFALSIGSRSTGYPVLDPSIGYGQQALGRRAAVTVLRGENPWWNHFEGGGAPLAGSIGTATFFPPTLLLALPNGLQLELTAVEIIAGIGMFLLLRCLQLGRFPAVVGALLFELASPIAWLAGDVANVAAVFPYLLYGIERMRRAAVRGASLPWQLVALAIAVSLYAGFPETAYLDGLLAVCVAILRLAQMPSRARLPLLAGLTGGGVAGVVLASPVLLAFADYLREADAGGHLTGSYAAVHLQPVGLPQLLLPYVWGPIFHFAFSLNNQTLTMLWSNVGGYAGFTLPVLALVSCLGRRERALRVLLGGWVAVMLAATFGVPLVQRALEVVPLLSFVALYRYAPTSWNLALVVLAAFALDDVLKAADRRLLRRYAAALVVMLLAVALSVSAGMPLVHALWADAEYHRWWWLSLGIPLVTAAAMLAAWALPSRSARALALGAVALAEATLAFVIPIRANPTSGSLDDGAVAFLRAHLGQQRFYTLGPIAPNYGSYYGLASVNHNDIPVPTRWLKFVHRRLDPSADPILFTGDRAIGEERANPRTAAFREHLGGFESAGVRYVVAPPGVDPTETVVEPAAGETAPAPLMLPPGGALQDEIEADAPPGRLRSVAIALANGFPAEGVVHAALCTHEGTCARGTAPIGGAAYLRIPLEPPALLDGGPLRLTINRSGGRGSLALALHRGDPFEPQRLGGEDVPSPGALDLRFGYASPPYVLPLPLTLAPQQVALPPDGEVIVRLREGLPRGSIDGLGLAVGTASPASVETLALEACASGRCARARRVAALGSRSATAWFALNEPIRVGVGELRLTLRRSGGTAHAWLWLRPTAGTAVREEVTGSGGGWVGEAVPLAVTFRPTDLPVLRFADTALTIHELAHPRPYFAATGCTLTVGERDRVQAQCAAAGSLERLELFMRGWHASVNGTEVPIEPLDQTFQRIALPPGASDVRFTFSPPSIEIAEAAALITLGLMPFGWVRRRARRSPD